MSSFKPKPSTKKDATNKKANVTLDSKHEEFIEKFKTNEQELIPELENERESIKALVSSCKDMDEKMDLIDKYKELGRRIKELKKSKKEYFLDNSKFIFSYFENKKNICDGKGNTKVLYSFFNMEKGSAAKQLQENTTPNNVKQYLANVDVDFLDINNFITDADICKMCEKGELIPQDDEGILVCTHCSRHFQYLIDNEKPSYKEPPKEVCFYAYQRINHFREILAQFQAKETTQIPEEVLEDIKNQLKKERIDISQLTERKMKEILKRLSYSKYYEHIAFIKYKLGIKPPVMSTELQETLCNLFLEIQAPYSKHCPKDRTNFLSYRYTVYKLCELLDQTKFLPHLSMLKDKVKRIEQDEIWKKICEELDWEFIPTL